MKTHLVCLFLAGSAVPRLLAQKPINEIVVSGSCSVAWVTILQTVHAPLQLKASDKDAGVLYFVSTSRASDADSNEAVKQFTTARLARIPSMWNDFGIDALNFALRSISNSTCLVHMDMAYSATNILVGKRTPLYTNGAFETEFLTQLRDAFEAVKPAPVVPLATPAPAVPRATQAPADTHAYGGAIKMPTWVPAYPDTYPELYTGKVDVEGVDLFTFVVLETPKRVYEYYHVTLRAAGFEEDPSGITGDGVGMLTAQDKAQNHALVIRLTARDGVLGPSTRVEIYIVRNK